jgi:hydroxyacylglutathione hydrolase
MKLIPFANTPGELLLKARNGWGLSDEKILSVTGLSAEQWAQASTADTAAEAQAVPAAWLEKLAPILQMRTAALIDFFSGGYQPTVPMPAQVERFFDEVDYYTPNAYVLWDERGDAVLFDTTTLSEPILAFIAQRSLTLRAIFLTHTHHDHVQALHALQKAWPEARAYVSARELLPGVTLLSGEEGTLSVGRWSLRWVSTPGHTVGGITYVVERQGQPPLAFVGDTLFAASVGKALGPAWPEGLRQIREKIFTLSGDTVVCSGHGPLTTIALEKSHNPFFIHS